MILKLFLYSLIFVSSLYANINIDKNTSKVALLPHASMYLDTTSQMSFEEVQNKTFEPVDAEHIRLGYTKSSVWIRFTINNKLNKHTNRYITIDKPILDTIVLYQKKEHGYQKTTRGILSLGQYELNNILHPNILIQFKPYEQKTIYLKVHSNTSSNNFSLFFKDVKTLYEDAFEYQIVKTIFLGTMLGLIIYNLFLFFFIKESIYIYYVLYMFFLTAYYITYTQLINCTHPR